MSKLLRELSAAPRSAAGPAGEAGAMMLEQALAAAAVILIAAAAVPAAWSRLSGYLIRFNESGINESSDIIINVRQEEDQ